MPSFRKLLALSFFAAPTMVALGASAQQPNCIPNQQPLPPNYGAAGHVPPPCPPGYVPPGYAQPRYYGAPPQREPGYAQQPPPGYAQQPPPGYAQPQPQPPPAQSDDAHEKRSSEDDVYWSLYMDLISLRVGTYDIRGSDADTKSWGFLFSIDPDLILTSNYVTYRSTLYAAIGGGTEGLEGEFDWSWGVGARGYFGDDHGPFARIGMGLEFLGNDKLYRSYFELPELRAGYQLHNSDALFEIAGAGGLILGGRYNTGDDATRRIKTEPELGAAFTLQTDGFRLDARYMRIFARQTRPGTPIDQLKAELCVNPLGWLFLCANGAWHRGDVILPNERVSESTALYLGGTIGIGSVQTGGSSGPTD